MNLLFCYDGPIVVDKKNNYYGVALNNKMFERYKVITDNITIAMRVNALQNLDVDNRYSLISNEYKVVKLFNLSSLKGMIMNKKKDYNILKKEISCHDIIMIRLPSFIGFLAVQICKELNKKYCVEVVGCPLDAFWNYNFKGKVIAPYAYYKMRKSVKHAPFVQYVSNEFLQKRYPTQGKNIACSDVFIDEKNIDVILKLREKRINQFSNKNKIVLGTVAAVDVKYKGQQYVIKAINYLTNLGYNIEYQLVGGGNEEYLKKIAKRYKVDSKIKFLGLKPHDEVFTWLEQIDIYIQPSSTEGMCRALIEAMSRGCPCIVSNAGGNPELVNKNAVFKKKNVKSLINTVKFVINSNLNDFSKENILKSKCFYDNVLNEKRVNFYNMIKSDI